MNLVEVQIERYVALDKSFLKGFFTLVLHLAGFEIIIQDCKHFNKDGKDWITLPQKEVPQREGEKSKYYNYIRFPLESVRDYIYESAVNEVKKQVVKGSHGQKKVYHQDKKAPNDALQDDSSSLPF